MKCWITGWQLLRWHSWPTPGALAVLVPVTEASCGHSPSLAVVWEHWDLRTDTTSHLISLQRVVFLKQLDTGLLLVTGKNFCLSTMIILFGRGSVDLGWVF